MVDLSPLLLLSIGLLGGAHCIGMCGPLVTIYSRQMGSRETVFLARQHVLLNLGRVTVYAALGGLLGLLGSVLGSISFWSELTSYTSVAVGILIVLFGVRYLTPKLYSASGLPSLTDRAGNDDWLIGKLLMNMRGYSRSPGIFFLGFLHGFLPCPIIVPPLLYAFSTGDPVTGFLSMALIGIGTFPTMVLFGVSQRFVAVSRRIWMLRVLGLLLILLGLIPLLHGLKMLGYVDFYIQVPVYQPFNSG